MSDILDFSKIEAGKLELEKIEFDLVETVEDIVELFSAQASMKKVEISCLVRPATPSTVRGDPGRLRQILANLVGNAVKFTQTGEVIVSIQLEEESADFAIVRFKVRDTGIGVPAEAQASLFRAFNQVDSSHSRKYGGTGLGLAIAKQLCALMGGQIGMESEPAKGSTFWFTARFEKSANQTRSREEPIGSFRKLRVLVVDDNATNREILQGQLASWQVHCQAASNAREALELSRVAASHGERFQLVILDRQMPEVDGIALAKMIKKEPLLGQPQLVLLSSLADVDDASETEEAGIDACLCKPLRKSNLYQCIANMVERKSLLREGGGDRVADLSARGSVRGERVFNGSVLLAEDNPLNQEFASLILQSFGLKVDIAQDGQEAIEATKKSKYDLIFLDCQMSVLDGFQTVKVIREREAKSVESSAGQPRFRVPVIALTAHAVSGDRERCLKAGMDDYLSKPFNKSQMGLLLERWLCPVEVKPVCDASLLEKTGDVCTSASKGVGLLDPKALDVIRQLQRPDKPDVLAKMLQTYQAQTIKLLETLRAAGGVGDVVGVRNVAHALKSSSANVGATELSQLARKLESTAASLSRSDLELIMEEIVEEFGRIAPALAGSPVP